MVSLMSVTRLATESAELLGARADLERTLQVAARDLARGEEIDEAIAAARRACDEAELLVRGKRRRGRGWDDLVAELYERAHLPWIGLRIGAAELATVRTGAYVSIIGAEGSGKSSFALQMLIQHERDHGPAIYVTPELDGDESVGRAIGQDKEASWKDVLTGLVPRGTLIRHPRFTVLEREAATLVHLEEEVLAVRAEYPDLPIMVGWDHLQASPGDGDGERMRIAKLSSDLRRFAKRMAIVLIAISQSSRAGASKLDSGESIGIDASRTGAESAQIERDSYVVISLGDRQKRDDGTESRSISIGKDRMAEPDIVYPSIYTGRTGRWWVEQQSKPASEVRAERAGREESSRINAAELAMKAFAQMAAKPVTRDELRRAAATKGTYAKQAIENLLARIDLVEVDQRQPRSRFFMLSTPTRAAELGVALRTETDGFK